MALEGDKGAGIRQSAEEQRRAEEAERRAEEAERRAEEAERRAEEAFSQLQRMKADFDNFRRRLMMEQVRWQDQATARLAQDLLPVVDNLERALSAGRAAAAAGGPAGALASLLEGIEMVLRQFRGVLEKAGVTPLAAEGQPFDPERHEAVARTEDPAVERPTVVEELQRGYLFKGQLLRPALVRVAMPAPSREGAEAEPACAEGE